MSNLSMVEARLPPGFRFHPRDEELVCDYLMKKVTRCHDLQPPLLVEVDLNKSEPWDIPESACVGRKEWYFYSQRDRKYATGLRTNRATVSGYWKATGKDRPVLGKGRQLVGMRKTLVFYQGRAPKGKKTDWVMHEFRLEGPFLPPKLSSSQEDWVLCRVFYKNRGGGVAKQGMESISCSSYDDSSSLPPLMEPHRDNHNNLTFEHTQKQANNISNPNLIDEHYEQVPCFSIFTTNQTTNQTLSHMITTSQQHNFMDSNPYTKITSNSPTFGPIPFPSHHDVATYLNPSFSSDKTSVIKAVLNQYLNKETDTINPKIINHSSTFGTTSDQSFLSDVGLPTTNTMWYHY